MTCPTLAKAITILASAATLSIGCSQQDPCYDNPASCATQSSTSHKFVVTELDFPDNLAEDATIGLDLDDDFEIDNDFGVILGRLKQLGNLDLENVLNEAIAKGEIILLVDVRTADLDDSSNVLGQVLIGKDPSVAPCTDESDTVCGRHLADGTSFSIDSARDFDAAVVGDIASSSFVGGPNAISIEIDLEEIANVPAFHLDGEAVRAESRRTSDGGLEGVIGGAIPYKQIEGAILPALISTAHDTCQPHASPDKCCIEGSIGAQLIATLDAAPYDCRLSVDELLDNQLISSMLAPSLDVLDDSGNYTAAGDGKLDTKALGVRFQASPADF